MDMLDRFLDEDGKIKQMPTKKEPKLAVLAYLAEKYEAGRDYTEKEFNPIIDTCSVTIFYCGASL